MSTFEIKSENGKIYCLLADAWHIETPEERVRQEYIKKLVDDYGYSLEQMAQEVKVNNFQRGQGKARADIVIWKNKEDNKGYGHERWKDYTYRIDLAQQADKEKYGKSAK